MKNKAIAIVFASLALGLVGCTATTETVSSTGYGSPYVTTNYAAYPGYGYNTNYYVGWNNGYGGYYNGYYRNRPYYAGYINRNNYYWRGARYHNVGYRNAGYANHWRANRGSVARAPRHWRHR
jgi:hypothetical protein